MTDFHRLANAMKGAAPTTADGFTSVADFTGKTVPSRPWIFKDWIPDRNVTLLIGVGGVAKSLAALQCAASVATGKPWLGLPVQRKGPVLCLSAEDEEDELHRRFNDIAFGYGCSFDDLVDVHFRSLAGQDALLAFEDKLTLTQTALYDEIEAAATTISPAMIQIDTLADVFPSNENDRTKARQFIGLLRGLALRQDCAVLLLAHPSLSGAADGSGRSGSTAWEASVRSRLYLERVADEGHEANPDARRLRSTKLNYGRLGAEVGLSWRDGMFYADPTESALDRTAKAARAERVFLKLLHEFETEGRRVRPSQASGYAPTVFSKSGRAEGCSKNALQVAMESLFAKRLIEVREEGPPSRRVKYIAATSL